MNGILIRNADIEGAELILHFIKSLARYEKAEDQVEAKLVDIEESIFGDNSTVEVIICCFNNQPVGFSVSLRYRSLMWNNPITRPLPDETKK